VSFDTKGTIERLRHLHVDHINTHMPSFSDFSPLLVNVFVLHHGTVSSLSVFLTFTKCSLQ